MAGVEKSGWAAYLTRNRMRNKAWEDKHAMAKNTICVWYDKDAEAAARFYAKTFPDSAVGAVYRAPSDYPVRQAGRRADG